MFYSSEVTKFEVQSLAYGILRKNLYPKFLVRGDYAGHDIALFKTNGTEPPTLRMVIGVMNPKTIDQIESLGVSYIHIKDNTEAFKILSKVVSHLE